MASIKGKIVTITKPTLTPDVLEFDSVGEGEDGARANTSKGMNVLVVINKYTFPEDDIKYMSLDCTGYFPTLQLSVIDGKGQFSIDTFPRDGDVISIRIGTLDKETYKDIRMDFDIIRVDTPPQFSDVPGGTYSFMGRSKIPGLFADECKSYGEGTSLEHIEAIADDLGLGFATNIESADDSMHLITPFTTRHETIQDLVRHSYVDLESFQTYSIDAYYNINYVDLNSIFNSEETFETAIMAYDRVFNDSPTQQEDEVNQRSLPLFLSNHSRDQGTNRFIVSSALKNTSGGVMRKNGYKRTIQYYENDSEEGLISHEIVAMSSKNMKDIEEPMRGRRDEDRYKNEVKYKYVGRTMGDVETSNTHLNYEYAAISNMQNLDETKKMSLEIDLETFNPAIYRYQRVPVAMYINETERLQADKFNKENKDKAEFQTDKVEEDAIGDPAAHVLDEFLSGYYIVDGITYTFRRGDDSVRQKLRLLRREWPSRMNAVTSDTVAKVPEPTPEKPAPVPPVAPPQEPTPTPPPPPEPTPATTPPPSPIKKDPIFTVDSSSGDWRTRYGGWLEQRRLFTWTVDDASLIDSDPKITIKIGNDSIQAKVYSEIQTEGQAWTKKTFNAEATIPGGKYEGKKDAEIILTYKDITVTTKKTVEFLPWEAGKTISKLPPITVGKRKNKKQFIAYQKYGETPGIYVGYYTLASEATANSYADNVASGVIEGTDGAKVKKQMIDARLKEAQSV